MATIAPSRTLIWCWLAIPATGLSVGSGRKRLGHGRVEVGQPKCFSESRAVRSAVGPGSLRGCHDWCVGGSLCPAPINAAGQTPRPLSPPPCESRCSPAIAIAGWGIRWSHRWPSAIALGSERVGRVDPLLCVMVIHPILFLGAHTASPARSVLGMQQP